MTAPTRRRWSLNRTLAVLALLLGALAILGNPYRGSVVSLDTRELATIVEGEVDHVTAEELADWIIQGTEEYRLIDLRDETSFAEYHVPTAEFVPITELPDYPLFRNEKIVLYSDGGLHSAQAWFLLKAMRFGGVYILLGGLDAWKEDVLFPALPAEATAEQQAEFERVRTVSQFFGGSPRSGVQAADDDLPIAMPAVEMPTQPVVTKRKRKKKKGC